MAKIPGKIGWGGSSLNRLKAVLVSMHTDLTNTTAELNRLKALASLAGANALRLEANDLLAQYEAHRVDESVHFDGVAELGTKVRAALEANTDVTDFFTISGSGSAIILTAKTAGANDATMSVDIADDTSTGVTSVSSANTVAGVASVDPVLQVETLTIGQTITGDGNARVVVTAAGMANSPKSVVVAVLTDDTPTEVAAKVRSALNEVSDITDFFTIAGEDAVITFTTDVAADNDETMVISIDNDGCTGLSSTSSADTVAGAVAVAQVETLTVGQSITGSGNLTATVTAVGMTGSPKAVSVAVLENDVAGVVGGNIRTALDNDADVAAFFTITGSGDEVILTAITPIADDATMNLNIDNDTCSGLTSTDSVDTQAGVALTAQVETLTVGQAITAGGKASLVVTADGMTNSPKTLSVEVEAEDTVEEVGEKLRTALGADEDVIAFFTVSGADAAVILTAITGAADDATMDMTLTNEAAVGLSATDSTTTVDGVANVDAVAQVETLTVAGTVTESGDAALTVTAVGLAGTPISIAVPVTIEDGGLAAADLVNAATESTLSSAFTAINNPVLAASVADLNSLKDRLADLRIKYAAHIAVDTVHYDSSTGVADTTNVLTVDNVIDDYVAAAADDSLVSSTDLEKVRVLAEDLATVLAAHIVDTSCHYDGSAAVAGTTALDGDLEMASTIEVTNASLLLTMNTTV